VIAPDFVLSEIHKRAIGPDGEPLGESPMVKSKIMTAEEAAKRIARAIETRQRELLMSSRGKLGRWLKLLAPGVIDRIAAKAIRDRH
jgi:short-subunit dehydrogenase